jgi:hypothetical protein
MDGVRHGIMNTISPEEVITQDNMLYVDSSKIDILCQNTEFWNALQNQTIVSVENFNIKVWSENNVDNNGEISLDKSRYSFNIDSSDKCSIGNYLSFDEYFEYFVDKNDEELLEEKDA